MVLQLGVAVDQQGGVILVGKTSGVKGLPRNSREIILTTFQTGLLPVAEGPKVISIQSVGICPQLREFEISQKQEQIRSKFVAKNPGKITYFLTSTGNDLFQSVFTCFGFISSVAYL